MGFTWVHLVIILAIVLLLFGTKKLRNIGKDVGGAIKGFKDAVGDGEKGKDQNKEGEQQTAKKTEEGNVIEGEVTSKEKDKA